MTGCTHDDDFLLLTSSVLEGDALMNSRVMVIMTCIYRPYFAVLYLYGYALHHRWEFIGLGVFPQARCSSRHDNKYQSCEENVSGKKQCQVPASIKSVCELVQRSDAVG